MSRNDSSALLWENTKKPCKIKVKRVAFMLPALLFSRRAPLANDGARLPLTFPDLPIFATHVTNGVAKNCLNCDKLLRKCDKLTKNLDFARDSWRFRVSLFFWGTKWFRIPLSLRFGRGSEFHSPLWQAIFPFFLSQNHVLFRVGDRAFFLCHFFCQSMMITAQVHLDSATKPCTGMERKTGTGSICRFRKSLPVPAFPASTKVPGMDL